MACQSRLLINCSKSHLVPTQTTVWLGMEQDSQTETAPVDQQPLTGPVQGTPCLSCSELFASVMGNPLRLSQLCCEGASAGPGTSLPFTNKGNRMFPPDDEGRLVPLPNLRPLLWCWLDSSLLASPVPGTLTPPLIFIMTDASDNRWGLQAFSGLHAQGQWSRA